MIFRDRDHAGKLLAQVLSTRTFERPVVYALPRGGVPIARYIADRLIAPLDLVMARKIGVPWRPEVAAAAIADGAQPEIVFNEAVMAASGLTRDTIEELAVEQLHEIDRRRQLYMKGRISPEIKGRDAILVDDGIATGATFKAAVKALRRRSPARIIAAIPIAPANTIAELQTIVDDIVCLSVPEAMSAVSDHYLEFPQERDEEVIRLLSEEAAAPNA